MFKLLFRRHDLFKIISFAKKERIDKQYYVTSKENISITEKSAKGMVNNAEHFAVQMKMLIKNIDKDDIDKIRKNLGKLI